MTDCKNPYDTLKRELSGIGSYYSLKALEDEKLGKLPYCIRILLESAIRNCNNVDITESDVKTILDWHNLTRNPTEAPEISFKPARVLLQDFTGVPALVDLAAMRECMTRFGGDPKSVNPIVPVDLVVDHSVQVDFSRSKEARKKNEEMEFERNQERFKFLQWGSQAFKNLRIIPPGSGIVHQVNLEYLAPGVMNCAGSLYPDSLVGTDSHTPMIGGLGIVGWGVGGIEAESVMLGEPISMVLPQVISVKLEGKLNWNCTATDLVLTLTELLRRRNVVGAFVEFTGKGCASLSLADRATIANMAPEYGATIGFFPMDVRTLEYMRLSGREESHVLMVEQYAKAQGLFQTYEGVEPIYSDEGITLSLNTILPSVAGPKRPQDRVSVSKLHNAFTAGITAPVSFSGFGLSAEQARKEVKITYKDKNYLLKQGAIVIAAITSCTNTSNPDVMLGAGMLAKKAVQQGLKVLPYIKTSLSPGSGVVKEYLQNSELLDYLEQLGFYVTGLGCQTCIGNSGDLDDEVADAIKQNDLVAVSVLSGNRNFEGRVHPLTRANYLTSPMYVVAYALAGRIDIDFETEPLGSNVFLRDIWPSRDEIANTVSSFVNPSLFTSCYKSITSGNVYWNQLKNNTSDKISDIYEWEADSTYIHYPPFLDHLQIHSPPFQPISKARCLLNLGDSVTTDHISPAGKISPTSPAGRYLISRGVEPPMFNSYGARRGHDEIMTRGTFANTRLVNKLSTSPGPTTLHVPSGKEMAVFDAVQAYKKDGVNDLIILAGKEYGTGSSRDWAAKGTILNNVKVVICESYERIHRSNLIGMGVLPLQFLPEQNADTLGLTGRESYDICLTHENVTTPRALIDIIAYNEKGEVKCSFKARSSIYTEIEARYYSNEGILPYVLRKIVAKKI